MAKGFFEIRFTGTKEVLQVAERRQKLLSENIRNAVARTVLWGAARIAEDCPVDTGRLRSSILGYLADTYGISIEGDPTAIAEGKNESTTEVKENEGKIGTNVKYVLPVEYGHKVRTSKNPKNIHKRINKRAGTTFRVKGKGMFRKNIPLIDRYFHEQMEEAVKATKEDRLLPVTF